MVFMLQIGMNRYLLLVSWLFVCTGAAAQNGWGVLVHLKPGVSLEAGESQGGAASRAAKARTVALEAQVPISEARSIGGGLQYLRFAKPQTAFQMDAHLRRLRLHPDVVSVESDEMLKLQGVPNDPGFASQWFLHNETTSRPAALNMPSVWDRVTGTAAITMAVVDSGIRPHPDLAGRLLPGYDFVSESTYANDGDGRDSDPTDPGDWVSSADKASNNALFGSCNVANSSWHGTFIAGIIAATGNNGAGVAGLNWGGRILPVRVGGKCGALLSDLLDGMRWAAGLPVTGAPTNPNPARIINVSFGGSSGCLGTGYQTVIDEITAIGGLVVVAGGNEAGPPTRPADCKNVVSVGAVRADGAKTSYSNFGSAITLVAPGGSTESSGANLLYSTLNTGLQGPTTEGYGSKQGTSFSAPVVVGLASLMWSLNPTLTPEQLMARLKSGTKPFSFNATLANCPLAIPGSTTGLCNCNVNVCGTGMVDGPLALAQALIPRAGIAPVNNAVATSPSVLDAGPSVFAIGERAVTFRWAQLSGASALVGDASQSVTTVTPPAAGPYVFRMTVTDTGGRSAEATVGFVATAAPVVVSPIPSPSPVSNGGGGATDALTLALLALLLGCAALRRTPTWQPPG